MTNTEQLAGAIFGPDYFSVKLEEIGLFDVAANRKPVEVKKRGVIDLPPGGYVLRYSSGEYLVAGQTTTIVGGKHGLKIKWKPATGQSWEELPFPDIRPRAAGFSAGWDASHLMSIEFGHPSHLILEPPSYNSAVGTVKIRIIRFIPKFLG